MFDSGTQPKALEKEDWIVRDVHCVPSLIKQFFRELPNSPLQQCVMSDGGAVDKNGNDMTGEHIEREHNEKQLDNHHHISKG